ncbi:hypothetical protein [Micromonospora sp. HM5-17]|uniref:hypothetical protein n=1 Tax=Micromonospora sp. HM5-17 TaxID=2487710 RepID=UPI0011CE2E4F|nr:hypothetical protein [Micromonospora sp. HM5-17]
MRPATTRVRRPPAGSGSSCCRGSRTGCCCGSGVRTGWPPPVGSEYSPKECVVGNLPAPDSNTKRCHPARWTPDGQAAEREDWFNKYVVTQVTEADRTTGLPPTVTRIE